MVAEAALALYLPDWSFIDGDPHYFQLTGILTTNWIQRSRLSSTDSFSVLILYYDFIHWARAGSLHTQTS